jgi:hypothetical protein
MTDPDINANPESISDKLDGQVDGQPLSYDIVDMLRPSTIFSLRDGSYPEPEGENTSPSFIDHENTMAKIYTRTFVAVDGKTYDGWDAIMTILNFVLSQPKAG